MKTTKLITAIGCLLIPMTLIFSCKKENKSQAVTYKEENPLNSFLLTTGLNQSASAFINPATFEMGFAFKPKVKGKIKAITVKLPYSNSSLKVTIWDKATGSVLKSVYVNVPNADQETTSAIDEIVLNQNAEYVISINSSKFYNHRRTDMSNINYPVDAGNITITGSYTSNSNPVTIPNNPRGYEFTGDYSFVFQQIN
jgi:hypothetical protein